MVKISIIIPIYNVEPYVEQCLKSVMDQTYQGPMECILVDDCSTDKSLDVVKRLMADYQGTIQFVVLHHDRNRGQSAARNTGMEFVTGDYIYFLDSDDEITIDCIEKLVAPLAEENYDLIVGNLQTIGDEKLNAFLMLKLSDGEVLREKEIENAYRRKWSMAPVNNLYRTAFIRQQHLSFREGIICEDELWSLQIACLAKSLRAVNYMTYLYKIREGSTTTAEEAKARISECLKVVVAEICKFLKERHIFSVRAYQLMMEFFWRSLEPVLNNQSQFIQEYCQLRKATRFSLNYRLKATGLHIRAQLRNIYFLLPSHLAAEILYRRINRV